MDIFNFKILTEVKGKEQYHAEILNRFAALENLEIRIYRTIILPVVLYGCETWSLKLSLD
jgi:hypothetical protein